MSVSRRRSSTPSYGSGLVRSLTPIIQRTARQAVNAVRRNSLFSTPGSFGPIFPTGRTPVPVPRIGGYRGPFKVGSRGMKVKSKKRKLRFFDKKPKVNKKFKKNFQKLSNSEKNCGKYTYISNVQLRQTTLDEQSIIFNDVHNLGIRMGGARDILDAASILFGSKTAGIDFDATVNNIENDQKIPLVKGTIDFFFKSTSGHVVNVELFECTYKKGTPQVAIPQFINDSIASGVYLARGLSALGVAENQTYNMSYLGSKFEDLQDIWKYFTMKVHKFKLQPGDYATKHFNVFGSKTYNMNLNQTNNSTDAFSPGCKVFFFRIINDVTVSGDATGNKIHAFPSNNKGGIACRYTKTYKILSPTMNAATVKKVVVGNWCHKTETTDQQVLYQNPSGSAAIDT